MASDPDPRGLMLGGSEKTIGKRTMNRTCRRPGITVRVREAIRVRANGALRASEMTGVERRPFGSIRTTDTARHD